MLAKKTRMTMFASVVEAQEEAIEAYQGGDKDYAKDLFFMICRETGCVHSAEVLLICFVESVIMTMILID